MTPSRLRIAAEWRKGRRCLRAESTSFLRGSVRRTQGSWSVASVWSQQGVAADAHGRAGTVPLSVSFQLVVADRASQQGRRRCRLAAPGCTTKRPAPCGSDSFFFRTWAFFAGRCTAELPKKPKMNFIGLESEERVSRRRPTRGTLFLCSGGRTPEHCQSSPFASQKSAYRPERGQERHCAAASP